MSDAIAVGVSACLLGEKVRYDGGHKHDRYITGTLGRFFTFVPVCPEVECGLSVPREAMRLEGDPAAPRLVTNRTRVDLTAQMLEFCHRRVLQLESENLCGFIFKKDSPSSGLHRVKVYNQGVPAKSGRGLFADAFVKQFPLLPVEEEGRLADLPLRENFIERVFAVHSWKEFLKGYQGVGDLVAYHTTRKLQVMAHSPDHYRKMGRLVAGAKGMAAAQLLGAYVQLLMAALSLQATVKKNVNVLSHIMGYFKRELSREEKLELLEVIDHYHRGLLPLIVPVTLLKHYVSKYGQDYLARQSYLAPHPLELMLRNHV